MPDETAVSDRVRVSVICRSMGRPQLARALSSLTEQTHRNLEVLLVNAGASDLAAFVKAEPELGVREIRGAGPLSRPQAANAGLAAASGDYLIFLDEDDWIAPEHIATLLQVLLSTPAIRAAYSSTQKTREDGTATGEILRQPYDRSLLLRDNFVAIHAVLFSRQLLDLGCRFDTDLDIYEDWDFWLQLSEHTDFGFVDSISAFYRAGGESETSQQDESVRYQPGHVLGKARARLFDKWLQRWSGEDLNQLLGSMDQGSLIRSLQEEIRHRDDALRSEHQTNLEHQQHILEHQQHIRKLREDIRERDLRFEEALASIKNTLSWRITKPLRRLRSWLPGPGQKPGNDRSTDR